MSGKRTRAFAQYRRKYFAMCRELGLDDETRHAYNESVTGRASTRDWDRSDWQAALGELAIRAGLEPPLEDGYGPVRHAEGRATYAQVRLIRELAWELRGYWTAGAEAYVRARVLTPQRGELRAARWSGRWEDLWPQEASAVIQGLLGVKDQVRKYHLDRAAVEN